MTSSNGLARPDEYQGNSPDPSSSLSSTDRDDVERWCGSSLQRRSQGALAPALRFQESALPRACAQNAATPCLFRSFLRDRQKNRREARYLLWPQPKRRRDDLSKERSKELHAHLQK